ncbi:MAG: hypothetical protein QM783_18690 [Phycisphaerales bacterium]
MKRVAIYSSCITETIGRLPGVATTDWADRAAAALRGQSDDPARASSLGRSMLGGL